jgi:hypothetical protein
MNNYEFVGESIDKLVSLDIRPPHLEQGILEKLYRASREKMKRPLTSLAAEKLKETLNPESLAIISTGFVLPPYFPTNTDALNEMLKRVQHDKKKYVIPNLFRNLEFSNDNKLIAFVLV